MSQLFAYICIKLIPSQLPLRLFLMQKISQQNEPGPPNKANIWTQMHAGKEHPYSLSAFYTDFRSSFVHNH